MSDSTPTYERMAQAAILLRNNGFPDVEKFLMAKEQRVKQKTRNPVYAEVTQNGRKVKGGKNKHEKIDWNNPDIVYVKEER